MLALGLSSGVKTIPPLQSELVDSKIRGFRLLLPVPSMAVLAEGKF